jgi:hypothetical protein
MARGSKIVLEGAPRGKRVEGVASGVLYPGMLVEVTTGTLRGGRHTWVKKSGDGVRGMVAVIEEDAKNGRDALTAYASGDVIPIYFPVNGEEFNLLKVDISGTGSPTEDLTVGESLKIVEGKLASSDTPPVPEVKPFIAMEAVVDQAGDTLVWVQYAP